jgi:hypothetical protein
MLKIQAFGNNVIARVIKKTGSTFLSEVVSCATGVFNVGDKIIYTEWDKQDLQIDEEVFHCLWDAKIRCREIKQEE